jgi:hypothetical protein
LAHPALAGLTWLSPVPCPLLCACASRAFTTKSTTTPAPPLPRVASLPPTLRVALLPTAAPNPSRQGAALRASIRLSGDAALVARARGGPASPGVGYLRAARWARPWRRREGREAQRWRASAGGDETEAGGGRVNGSDVVLRVRRTWTPEPRPAAGAGGCFGL